MLYNVKEYCFFFFFSIKGGTPKVVDSIFKGKIHQGTAVQNGICWNCASDMVWKKPQNIWDKSRQYEVIDKEIAFRVLESGENCNNEFQIEIAMS